ncbi:hypothetical protein B0H10DRAFT_2162340 [Mycena sp. CBHHK59/15]|nr:hypothetical protein B0H10DRAFT_2162340 [Mycena sp. CBHHK59/15]
MDDLNDSNLWNLPLVDVYKRLQCDEDGLAEGEAARRLEIERRRSTQKRQGELFQFLSFLWNPVCWMMELCALGLLALSSGRHHLPAWRTFLGITALLCVNSIIGLCAERRAYNVARTLMDSANIPPNVRAKVKRAGLWSEIDVSKLVPGDIVSLHAEDIAPADCRITRVIAHGVYVRDQEHFSNKMEVGDRGARVSSGECEVVIIYSGGSTFSARSGALRGQSKRSTATDNLHSIVAQLALFCAAVISLGTIAEILVLYAGFHDSYHRGIDNIFVLLIGGIPIALPTVLSVTLSFGVGMFAEHRVLVNRVAAVEELARVTTLCVEMSGVLVEDEMVIDEVKTYGPFDTDEVRLLAAYANSTKDLNNTSSDSFGDYYAGGAAGHPDIEIFGWKALSYVSAQVTYRAKGSGKLQRVAKGMAGHIIERCTRNRTAALEDQFGADLEECARRGMRVVSVAHEELEGDDPEADGNGFELVGLLGLLKPPREDAARAVEAARALGVQVLMTTGEQLAIAKEAGRRIGLGDHMFPGRVFRDGPLARPYATLDELILETAGFAGLARVQRQQLIQRLQHMGHFCAMIGDLMSTQAGLSSVVDVIRDSRKVFERMRSSFIYTCALTIRTVLCFAILVVDHAIPSATPSSWDLTAIFYYASAYGLHLTLSTVIFVIVTVQTTFFQRTFGVLLSPSQPQYDNQLRMLVYLQVAMISHALVFVVRTPGFLFASRPSTVVLGVFSVWQVVLSVIARYGNCGFARVHTNLIWFVPLDWIKIAVLFALSKRHSVPLR